MSKIIKCKTCGSDIAASAKTCPGCGAKNKKALYKRPWFILIIIFIILGIAAGGGNKNSEELASNGVEETAQASNTDVQTDNTEKKDNIPTEYKNALKKAKSYSDTMYMSKAGLYKQLTSEYGEKFPAEAAQYAIDNVNANWKENALKKAKSYQESMAMSTSAIYDQLKSEYGEEFTAEEAQYAIDNLNK